jgi:hypothetical protein
MPGSGPALPPDGLNAGQVCLSDHGHQSPFRPPPGRQLREIAALAQLRDGRADAADPGVPVPLSVAVAGVAALTRALAVLGAAEGLGFGAHQLLHHRRQDLPKQVGMSLLQLLA